MTAVGGVRNFRVISYPKLLLCLTMDNVQCFVTLNKLRDAERQIAIPAHASLFIIFALLYSKYVLSYQHSTTTGL